MRIKVYRITKIVEDLVMSHVLDDEEKPKKELKLQISISEPKLKQKYSDMDAGLTNVKENTQKMEVKTMAINPNTTTIDSGHIVKDPKHPQGMRGGKVQTPSFVKNEHGISLK